MRMLMVASLYGPDRLHLMVFHAVTLRTASDHITVAMRSRPLLPKVERLVND